MLEICKLPKSREGGKEYKGASPFLPLQFRESSKEEEEEDKDLELRENLEPPPTPVVHNEPESSNHICSPEPGLRCSQPVRTAPKRCGGKNTESQGSGPV